MINILLVIIGTFTMALAGVIRKDDNKKILFRKNFLFTAIGVICIGIGTILNANEQDKIEKNLIIALKKNSQLSEKIAKLAEKSLDAIIGGKGYIVLMPLYLGGQPGDLSLIVTSYGEYPLYDVKIEITDVDALRELENSFTPDEKKLNPEIVVNALMRAKYSYEYGNKSQGHGRIIPHQFKIDYNGLTKREFNINIFARNGVFFQKLLIKKIGKVWVPAYKVTTNSQNNNDQITLFERVDERYANVEKDW